MSVIDSLPNIVFTLIPELREHPLTGESRADCAHCVMLPQQLDGDAAHPWAFNPNTRCCTIHPELPNYAVGRALLRGGPGADRIRARLGDRSGVTAWGIVASESYQRVTRASTERLGRDERRRCPYWIGGTYSCGVWQDRNAVCRTWFCKHDHGDTGLLRWNALRKLLLYVEIKLGRLLVELGTPPDDRDPDRLAAHEWEAWFTWCAGRVARLVPGDVAALHSEQFERLRARLAASMAMPAPALADHPVLVPVITETTATARGLALAGYSPYDGVELSPDIIELFARLDGRHTWAQAAGQVRASKAMTGSVVRELFRTGILRPISDVIDRAQRAGQTLPPYLDATPHDMPDVLIPAVQRPIVVGSRVWLQGEVPLASVIAPRSIFQFLARLDGTRSWQPALEETNRELTANSEPPIERALVRELFQIGALRPPATESGSTTGSPSPS